MLDIDLSNRQKLILKAIIEEYVSSGELESWHLRLYEDEGYQTYYWKRCHLSNYFDDFTLQL